MAITNKHVNKYFARYAGYIIVGFTALITVNYLQMNIPAITGDITDMLSTNPSMKALEENILKMLPIIALILLCRITWRQTLMRSSIKVSRDLRRDLYTHIVGMDKNFYNSYTSGEVMTIFTSDVENYRNGIAWGSLFIFDFLSLTPFVIYGMSTNVNLNTALLISFPLVFITINIAIIGRIVKRRSLIAQNSFGTLNTNVNDNLSGIMVTKSTNTETRVKEEFDKLNNKYASDNLRVKLVDIFLHHFNGVMIGLSYLVLYIVGFKGVSEGSLTIGEVAALAGYLGLLVWPMMALGYAINLFSRGSASLDRISKVYTYTNNIKEGNKDTKNLDSSIELKDLTFKYGNKEILSNINLSIDKGDNVAIIGNTGGGKTTLINILLRQYNVSRGNYKIGSKDVLDLKVSNIREKIAYSPQGSTLFNDTIENNIKFGKKGSIEQVIEASMIADLDDNIKNQTNGYQTLIGEKGVSLSGGQRQRLSIARAIFSNKDILILDDSLSAVDTRTEEQILNNLKQNRKGKTTIVTSNRVSTVKHFKKIVVLINGEIVGIGNHNELLKSCPQYKNIDELQKLVEEEGVDYE